MSVRWLYETYTVYRGFKVLYRGPDSEGKVLLLADDPAVAAELGFSPHPSGGYKAWVPAEEISEVIQETWYGEVQGSTVLILGEEGDYYIVETSRYVKGLGLEQTDKACWSGTVPKSAFSRVWWDQHTWRP